jgi:DNA-binding PadR family transcriptional regulator
VLLLLAEKPRHGYEIITELADRSDGRWRPSPGSVYPVLKRLAREGMVASSHEEGRRIFALTEEGRTLVAEQRAAWGEPWAEDADDATADVAMELWDEARQLAAATWQVAQTGDAELVRQTVALLTETRRGIYRLLADR